LSDVGRLPSDPYWLPRQEATGLQGVTDGEFRREFWHLDFLAGLRLARVKAKGTRLGRPRGCASADRVLALHLADPALSSRAIARRTGVSLGTVQRVLKARAA
jgi:hypothetical protein